MTDRLGRLLLVTLEAARVNADLPVLGALRSWLDSWRGIGDVERVLPVIRRHPQVRAASPFVLQQALFTSAGGEFHWPSFLEPWCWRAMRPRGGSSGSSAFSITRSPLRTTVRRLPLTVISNVFHSPMFRSASFLGVTPARTAADIFSSVR